MKIVITEEFPNVEDAQAFLAKVAGASVKVVVPTTAALAKPDATPAAPTAPATPSPTPSAEKPPVEKPARKPRSDAGQPRGPHKTTGEPAASEPGVGGQASAAPSQPAAPATPTPTPTPAPAAAAGTASSGEDARVALKRINDTKGMGTPACIQHLQDFGVNKLSDLPAEKFALFIKQADQKIAEHVAAAKK